MSLKCIIEQHYYELFAFAQQCETFLLWNEGRKDPTYSMILRKNKCLLQSGQKKLAISIEDHIFACCNKLE